jgi:hypothetical protein
MRPIRTFLCALGLAALSACGGGGSSGGAVPAGSAPGGIDPNGSTVSFQSGSLWVASEVVINKYSTDADGAATPLVSLGGFPWYGEFGSIPGPYDLAVAPDGTLWALLGNNQLLGSGRWEVLAYAPGETQGANPENHYHGDGIPFAFGLGGDGVLMETFPFPDGSSTISTYPYAATEAPPIRTFAVSPGHRAGFVFGYNSRIYLATSNGFESYRADSNGCCPVDRVTTDITPGDFRGSFAVGPDNSIYALDLVGFHQPESHGAVAYVNVYPPGKGTPARRIGPITISNGGLSRFPVIVVDGLGRFYVGQAGFIERFAANANGAAQPDRTITFRGNVFGLAIGP